MDLNLVHLLFKVHTFDATKFVQFFAEGVRRFDHFFRNTCCRHKSMDCQVCREFDCCAYSDVFRQEISTNPEIVRRHQKPALPYVFRLRTVLPESQEFVFELVVLGNAINHLNHFIEAVECLVNTVSGKLSGHGAFIASINCLDYQDDRLQLNRNLPVTDNLIVLSARTIMENVVCTERIRLIFDTPLRLLTSGKTLRNFDFGTFMCSQLRRCSSLFAYYGTSASGLDFQHLAAESRKVVCLGNYLNQNTPFWSDRLNCSGLAGIAEFRSVSACLLPMLVLGSHLNSGKGATVGFGSYRVELQ